MHDIAALIDDEWMESFAPREVFAHANRDSGGSGKALPGGGIIDQQRVFEPKRFDRFDCFGDLYGGADVVFPMAVDHDVVVPTDSFAAVFEALPDLHQFLGG